MQISNVTLAWKTSFFFFYVSIKNMVAICANCVGGLPLAVIRKYTKTVCLLFICD